MKPIIKALCYNRLAAFVNFIKTKAVQFAKRGKSGKKIDLQSEADFEKIPPKYYVTNDGEMIDDYEQSFEDINNALGFKFF